jgi:hypothetical protein
MMPDTIRSVALAILDSVDAHMAFDEAVAAFPEWAMNARPPNVDYTPWQLLEHLRITQWDILEYIRNPGHVSPDWPIGYWPDRAATATPEEFAATVAAFLADLAAFRELVADPSTDLLAAMPHTPGHTVMREVRIVADHNAYHIGELAILRQVMGSWPADRRG